MPLVDTGRRPDRSADAANAHARPQGGGLQAAHPARAHPRHRAGRLRAAGAVICQLGVWRQAVLRLQSYLGLRLQSHRHSGWTVLRAGLAVGGSQVGPVAASGGQIFFRRHSCVNVWD